MKTWIQTYTGKKFFPLDAYPDDIDIRDIARALSMTCRFAGHVNRFYSVAEHSVEVSRLCRDDKLWGLLHDAAEAYLNDIPSPVKHQPELAGYRYAEEAVMLCIAHKFDLSWPEPVEVKSADNVMVSIEAQCLKYPLHEDWRLPVAIELDAEQRETRIECLSPTLAESLFLSTFNELRNNS